MKHFLLVKCVLLLAFLMPGAQTFAEEYSYTFTSKQFSANGTVDLGGVSWTLAGDGDFWGYDGTKGHQFGSGSYPYKTMTFSTSGIEGTISKIVINTSGASSTKAQLQVTVGGNAFGEKISLTTTATAYTLEGSASGAVSFNYTQTTKKAIYIKSITITYVKDGEVLKEAQKLSFSQTEYSVVLGSTDFVEPQLTGAMTDVTYASSNDAVAEVDATTGEVTIVGEGTATITATAEEDEDYDEGSASYTIEVSQPVSTEGYLALVAEKAGVYYAMTSEVVSNHLEPAVVEVVNDKVIIQKGVNPSALMWKITDDGTTSTIQDIDDKYLVCGSNTSTSLYTQAKSYSWNNSPENSSWLSSTNAERTFIYSKSNGYFRNYDIDNIGTAGYADTYTVAMPFADGYVRIGLTDGKYGTICLPCAVEADDIRGMEVFSVVGKRVDGEGNPTKLVVAEESSMEAGVPYVFRATADEVAVAYTGEAVDAPSSANGLVGVFEDLKPIPGTGNYVISSNIIKKAGANTGVRANYAYIDMESVPVYTEGSSAKRIFEIGNGAEPTSIHSVAGDTDAVVDVYSITGVRLRAGVRANEATDGLCKGVYIVGGRKVVVR